MCTTSQRRRLHHALVFYGMIALGLTDLWVVTARYNPMLQGLVCPLGLFDPWKVLANVGGLAVAAGTTLMIRERWRSPDAAGGRTYADFLTVGLLLAAALTGFATEALHFARIDSLRYAAYATHLTTLVALFVALPYTKLAHGVYRTVALVFAERAGRKAFRRDLSGVGEPGAGAAKEGSS
jgi:quinone-modifying oxidoreductase subunit QmoC